MLCGLRLGYHPWSIVINKMAGLGGIPRSFDLEIYDSVQEPEIDNLEPVTEPVSTCKLLAVCFRLPTFGSSDKLR